MRPGLPIHDQPDGLTCHIEAIRNVPLPLAACTRTPNLSNIIGSEAGCPHTLPLNGWVRLAEKVMRVSPSNSLGVNCGSVRLSARQSLRAQTRWMRISAQAALRMQAGCVSITGCRTPFGDHIGAVRGIGAQPEVPASLIRHAPNNVDADVIVSPARAITDVANGDQFVTSVAHRLAAYGHVAGRQPPSEAMSRAVAPADIDARVPITPQPYSEPPARFKRCRGMGGQASQHVRAHGRIITHRQYTPGGVTPPVATNNAGALSRQLYQLAGDVVSFTPGGR